jgi:uncharacterized damage-inducible protein DinB
MPTESVAHYLYLLDGAFEATEWHSLLGNLRSVTPDDWTWVPPDGRRSIQEIVHHVAGAKRMYHNQAFGDGRMTWTDPLLEDPTPCATLDSALAWLREGQARLRAAVAALDDADLLALRRSPQGKLRETRWIITVMIQHDLYHAGEINHIRCLHQGNDE